MMEMHREVGFGDSERKVVDTGVSSFSQLVAVVFPIGQVMNR